MKRRPRLPAWAALAWLVLAATAAQSATERTGAGSDSSAGALGAGTPPPPGQYDANLCVSIAAGAGNCGPVVVDLGERGDALVLINDVAYRLQRVGDQLGVSLFHGTMQIDGFVVLHKWSGKALTFTDPEKGARYELQIGTRRPAPQ